MEHMLLKARVLAPLSLKLARRFGLIAFALALPTACGQDEEAAEELSPPEQTQLQEVETTCSTTMLSGACRGPWAYRPYVTPCYNEGRAAVCGTETYQEAKTCLVAMLGLQTTFTHSIYYTYVPGGSAGATALNSICGTRLHSDLALVAGDRSIVVPSKALANVEHEGDEWAADCIVTLTNAGTAQSPSCGFETRTRYKLCRAPEFGNAPVGACGTSATVAASESGKTLSELLAATPLADPSTPQCSTLEDVPVSASRQTTTVQRVSAQDPYWSTLPATASQEEQARLDLVKQAKLMYELGVASPATVRDLYSLYPQQELGCGVPALPQISDGCTSWGSEHGVTGPLGLCRRMLSAHVAPAVLAAEIDGCLDLLGLPALQEASACAAEYRGAAETMAEELLARAFASITQPVGTSQLLGLDGALRKLDRWYGNAAAMFTAAPAALDDATGRVLLAFWTRVHDAASPAPTSFPPGAAGSAQAGQMLDLLFSSRLEAERQVLMAAYASPAPLDEVPLLLITADALTPLYERLRTAAPLYDLACRISESCTVSVANEATRMIRILGALGDLPSLNAALSAAGSVRAPWLSAFSAIRDRIGALESSYRRATGRPDATLAELYQPNVIPVAADLEDVVSTSAEMWASYQGHGFLLPRPSNTLRAGMSALARNAVRDDFNREIGVLQQHRTDYQAARGDAANTILARIAQREHQDRLDAELELLKREHNILGQDLHGLMAAQDQSELVAGRFMSTYVERARQPDWLPDYPITGTPRTFSVNAAAARGNSTAVDSLAQVIEVAMRDPDQPSEPLFVTVAKGDMLTFQVTGQWAPTCALRASTLVGPTHTTAFSDPTNAMTGPEGYSISWSDSQLRAREHTSTNFSSETTESSVCGAVNANFFQYAAEEFTFVNVSGSASHCKKWQSGRSVSDTTSRAQRFTAAAEFAGGLRVPGTPFATAPGGALLAVEVSGESGAERVTNIQVIRPSTTLTFRTAAKVYLVVNDKTGCTTLNPGSLTVTYLRAESIATKARALAETMATVLTSLDVQRKLLVDQGAVTPSELSALEASAYDQLLASCNGCALSTFPEQIRNMFSAWLSSELAGIERQTRIAATLRGLDTLVLRLAALQRDLDGDTDSARLGALLTTWQLGHLAYHDLRDKTDLVLEYGTDYVLPMLRTRYPQALTLLRSTAIAPVEALRTADWALPYDELAFRLQSVAEQMSARLGQASVIGGQSSVAVMVAFPKPGTPVNLAVQGAINAPESRAAGVWETCDTGWCLKQRPELTITPEDVYGYPGVGLACGEAAPVVKAAAFYAANPSSPVNPSWNSNPQRFDVFRIPEVQFPIEDGNVSYRIGGPLGVQLAARMRSLAGNNTAAWSTFAANYPAPTDSAPSLTPFGTFALELGAGHNGDAKPFKTAHTIVAIFEVETRAALGPLAGVSRCSQEQQ